MTRSRLRCNAVVIAAAAACATSRHMRWLLAITVCGCAAHAGSGSAERPPPPAVPHAEVARAPGDVTVALSGGANAVWWDASASVLYLTDNNSSSLLTWSDSKGIQEVSSLPADAAGVSLGGIVRRNDGTMLVASFGFGVRGGLLTVASGAATALTGLEPTRRRVGLAQDGEGALYSAYFVGGGGKRPAGGVATIAIAGTTATETEIASGFHKAVGLVATPTALFVTDQTDRTIYKVAIPGYAVSKLASAPSVDLLAMLPNGDLLTGGGPTISRITQAGEVSTLLGGFEQVRGIAYDPAGQRLFVIDHSLTVGLPDKLRVMRFPAP